MRSGTLGLFSILLLFQKGITTLGEYIILKNRFYITCLDQQHEMHRSLKCIDALRYASK